MPKYEDYQIKTINKILKNYFPSDENTWPVRRMLVSDEVGLGKTYVAKGLIRAMAYRYLRDYDEDKLPEENNYPVEFRVLYLCSNLNIANQNKVKLGLDDLVEQSGDVVDIENRSKNNREYKENASENRTSMLYLQVLRNRTKSISFKELYNEYVKATGDTEEKYDEEKENRSLKIIVLPVTPNTSIKVKDAGWTQEREYILRMIEVCNIVEGFNYYRNIFELDIPISNKYEKLFESVSLKDSPEICRFKQCLEKYTEEITQILGKKEKLKVEEWEKLRVIFSLATLDVFVYNLAILDEFQNFHTIISGASEAARKRDYERKRKIFIYHFLKSVVPEHPLVEQYKKIEGFQSEIEKDENRISDYFENSNIKELCQSNTDKISNMSEEDLESRVEEIIKNNDFEIHIDNNRKDLGVHKSLFDDLCKIMNNNGPIIIEQEENRKNDCQENQEIVNAHLNELCKKLKNKTENKKKKYNPNLQYFLSAEDWLFYSIAYLSADNMERLYCKIRELRDKDCYEIFKGERWEKHPYIEIANWIKNTEFLNNNEKKIMSMNLYFVYLRKRNKQNAEEQITRMKEYYHTVFRYNNGNFGQAQNNYDKIELFRLYPEKQNQKVDYDNPEQDIIDKIFGEEENEDMRILLLSATPFKMYMGKEIPGGDVTDEKKETIKEVCDFLQRGGELSESLNKYKSTLIQFSKTSELSIPEELKRCKTDFLNKMGKCFTRMERGAVLRETNAATSLYSGYKEVQGYRGYYVFRGNCKL